MRVNQYSVQVKYSGDFEDYTKADLWKMAINKVDHGVDAYDRTIDVSEDLAKQLDGKIQIEHTYPCNKIATVTWYEIEELEEE